VQYDDDPVHARMAAKNVNSPEQNGFAGNGPPLFRDAATGPQAAAGSNDQRGDGLGHGGLVLPALHTQQSETAQSAIIVGGKSA
jgi:hypothetical protein